MARILEFSENIKLEGIATIKTDKGSEMIINMDQLGCLFAEFIADHDTGPAPDDGWYVQHFNKLRAAILTES